jgi:hypothetical protein
MGMDLINLAFVNMKMKLQFPWKVRNLLSTWATSNFKKDANWEILQLYPAIFTEENYAQKWWKIKIINL